MRDVENDNAFMRGSSRYCQLEVPGKADDDCIFFFFSFFFTSFLFSTQTFFESSQQRFLYLCLRTARIVGDYYELHIVVLLRVEK